MKLRFNGVFRSVKRLSGCSACGSKTITSSGLVRKTTKDYILPSGSTRTVRVGQVIEENDEDGMYLASLYSTLNGEIYRDFEVL